MPKPLHKFNKFHAVDDDVDGSRLRESAKRIERRTRNERILGSQERRRAQQKEAAQGIHQEKQEDVSALRVNFICSR